MKDCIIFCFLLLVFGCRQERLPESFETNVAKVFNVGDEYFSNVESLQFKITEINDSRCPSDVVCIWAGEAAVTIEAEKPISGNLRLSTLDNQTDTLGNYSFELVEVAPYPVSTEIIRLEDYEITLKINKLN